MLFIFIILYYALSLPICVSYWSNRIKDSDNAATLLVFIMVAGGVLFVLLDIVVVRTFARYCLWADGIGELLAKLNY